MALSNIERTINLDVYDHNLTPSTIKTIALDSATRYVAAEIHNGGQTYDIGQSAAVILTVIRPDNTGVQITGETFAYTVGEGETVYGAYAELSQVALAIKGNLKAQFKLTSGDQILRTEIFTINNGEALDASTDTWAGEYDGYNLDELVQTVNTAAAAVEEMQTDVSDLKEGLSDLESTLGFAPAEYIMPNGYQSANYANSAQTGVFKWVNDELLMSFHFNSAGTQTGTELVTSVAGLTIGDSLAFDLSTDGSPVLNVTYENTLPTEAATILLLRYYKADYSANKSVHYPIPSGTGELNIDVKSVASTNNIDLSVYPKSIIRGIAYYAFTSTTGDTFSVSAKGYASGGTSIVDDVDGLKARVADIEDEMITRDVYSSSSVMGNPFRFKPMYAHLFLNTVQDADIYVPSQSLYDIQISHRLGFDVIEVNTHLLTDGNYICCHGASGKFGLEFVSADGNSDATVQDTDIATVSLDWVRANVRYKAKYPKMRVSPPTLQEFLYECQKYKMIPLINYKGIDQVEIANSIVGKDNYIMYGAPNSVRNISNCIMNTWANLTTKEEILNWVDAVGNPCIVGCMHPEHFTESEWYDVVESVHKKGGLIFYSAYLSNTDQLKMDDYGFDGTGSTYKIPCTDYGNIQNLSSPTGFSDFTVTGGTEADGQLTMSANGTVTPAQSESARFLTGMWLDVTFIGSISVSMGRFITHGNCQSTASASKTIRLSTYGMNIAPTFEVKALTDGTVIENIVFKASEF